jgi:hypothetical protein
MAKKKQLKIKGGKGLAKQEMLILGVEKMRKIFMTDNSSDEKELKEYDNLCSKKKLNPKEEERMLKIFSGLLTRYGLKNGFILKKIEREQYYEALGEIRRNIVIEYPGKTSFDLLITDRLVANYWRAMKYDTIFNRLIENEEGKFSVDQLRVNILKELNKGIEIADRQLNANIILLKELKQPPLSVSVKTKTAFVAQNQQLNINPQVKDNPDEIINPK